jgi:hypothetical protein
VKGKNKKGENLFSQELSGWYLLSGISRIYTMTVPQEVCKELSRIDLEVKTDRLNWGGKLDVDEAMCLP